MRVAILGSRGYPSTYGGYETLVRYLSGWFVRRNHDLTVYCHGRQAGERTWTVDGVRCVGTSGVDTKSLTTLSHGLASSLHAARAGYDAILVLNVAHGFYLPVLRRGGVPVAVNVDGIEWRRGKWSAAGRAVFLAGARLSAAHADLLVCDSRAMGQVWERDFGRPSVFIPYGGALVESSERDQLDAVGIGEQPYLLVVARLVPENNVELTLDAVERLGDQAPNVVVVGSAGYRSAVERRLRDLDRAGRVRALGHVANQRLLTQLWSHCTVYVHGHSVGGTNPSLLQALGAGAPTLALDTPFNREVLGRDDHLYQPTAHDLARQLKRVLDDPGRRAEMREHGRVTVRERYDWDAVCAGYEALFDELIQTRRTTRSAGRARAAVRGA